MNRNIHQELKNFSSSVIFNSKNAENFVYQSLSKRSLNRECTKLHDSEEKRINTLKQVSVFSSLSTSQLRIMAHSMEETIYRRGDTIIQQDDLGRDFYILEKGEVKIVRKKDFNDPLETPKELVRLKNSASFGEMALITDELRSASVIVISKYATCQVMRKDVFQKCVEENKRIAQQQMKIIAQEIIPHVPLFKKLSKFSLAQLLDATVPINFPQNTYICRQFAQGHTFYILVEGRCKVTLNAENDGGEEQEVAQLSEGDFFGEIALMNSNHQRTANVISLTPVTCLSLSQEQFQKHFVNKKALKKLTGNSSKVFSETDVGKSNLDLDTASSNAQSISSVRRITGLDANNKPVELLKHDLFLRFSRYMFESRWLSVYWKLYRNICVNIELRKEAGDIAKQIMKLPGNKMKIIPILEQEVKKILEINPDDRQEDQLQFLSALITSNKNFMEEYCPEWTNDQIKELARRVRYYSIDSLSHLWKSGDVGTSAYLILKGSLRLFKREQNLTTGLSKTSFQEDRMAGDIVGETSLGGMLHRLYSAYTVTECEFLVIEEDDFSRAQGKLTSELTVQSKYEFLSQLSVFKNWDTYALYTLAQHLKQNEISNKAHIIKCDRVAEDLHFVIKGSVCVLSSQKNNKKIANIEVGGIIGETSILHQFFGGNMPIGKQKKSKRNDSINRYIEHRTMQAVGTVTLLTLDSAHFNLIDIKTVMKLHGIHRIRQKWRSTRTKIVQDEMKALKKFIRDGREYAAYENRKVIASNNSGNSNSRVNGNGNGGSSHVNPASSIDNSDDELDVGSIGCDDMSILSDVGASVLGKPVNFSNDDDSLGGGDDDTIMTFDNYHSKDNRDGDSIASLSSMSIHTGISGTMSILSKRDYNKKHSETEKLKDIAALTSRLDTSLDPIFAYNTVKTNRDRKVVRQVISSNLDGNRKEIARTHVKKNNQLASNILSHSLMASYMSSNKSSYMGGVSSIGSPGSISSMQRSVGGYSMSNSTMVSASSRIIDTRKLK